MVMVKLANEKRWLGKQNKSLLIQTPQLCK